MKKKQRRGVGLGIGLGLIQVFIAIGAIYGGGAFIAAPDGSLMVMPLATLDRTPFANFLIPGIILLVVNGVGSLVGATLAFIRHRYAGEAAILLGIFMMAWIVIQMLWVEFSWFQPTFFVTGLVEFGLGIWLRRVILQQ